MIESFDYGDKVKCRWYDSAEGVSTTAGVIVRKPGDDGCGDSCYIIQDSTRLRLINIRCSTFEEMSKEASR